MFYVRLAKEFDPYGLGIYRVISENQREYVLHCDMYNTEFNRFKAHCNPRDSIALERTIDWKKQQKLQAQKIGLDKSKRHKR